MAYLHSRSYGWNSLLPASWSAVACSWLLLFLKAAVMFVTCAMKSPLSGTFAFDNLVICCHYRMICINLRQYSSLGDLFRYSSEFELVLTNWSQTRDLESNLDKTVLYHYFEVNCLWRHYMGSL